MCFGLSSLYDAWLVRDPLRDSICINIDDLTMDKSGSAIVFPAEAYDPLKTLQAVQQEKATALYGVSFTKISRKIKLYIL